MASAGRQGDVVQVLLEMRVPKRQRRKGITLTAQNLLPKFQLDAEYEPIPVEAAPNDRTSLLTVAEKIVIVRGTISVDDIPQLEAQPNVLKVWLDSPVTLHARRQGQAVAAAAASPPAIGNCPFSTCDCDYHTAKGDLTGVAHFLGVDEIWAAGHKGKDVVIGIVDSGLTAQGRVAAGRIPNVSIGWPAQNWGMRSLLEEHGNMTATDAQGMAPEATLYDIRIFEEEESEISLISQALAGFHWAISQFRATGKPHILVNSWGLNQQADDPDYAIHPYHPFTRKAAEAVTKGIMVLFSSGNCGPACHDPDCGDDTGPGKGIWGANGHPLVITVGAANQRAEFIGYSSVGPAALDPHKPDVCGVSHFKGYFPVDYGTSAACPIVAGVAALLKQGNPALKPAQIKSVLQTTARQIDSGSEWNQYSGYGIIQAKKAYDRALKF